MFLNISPFFCILMKKETISIVIQLSISMSSPRRPNIVRILTMGNSGYILRLPHLWNNGDIRPRRPQKGSPLSCPFKFYLTTCINVLVLLKRLPLVVIGFDVYVYLNLFMKNTYSIKLLSYRIYNPFIHENESRNQFNAD